MLDIETRERTNSKGETYPQYFMGSQMVGCGCAQAKAVTIEKYGYAPCKHVREANTLPITTTDLVAHIEDDLRGSCCLCGRETKAIICWICLS